MPPFRGGRDFLLHLTLLASLQGPSLAITALQGRTTIRILSASVGGAVTEASLRPLRHIITSVRVQELEYEEGPVHDFPALKPKHSSSLLYINPETPAFGFIPMHIFHFIEDLCLAAGYRACITLVYDSMLK